MFYCYSDSEQVKLCVGRIRESLRPSGADIKWVEDDNYHITLKFWGSRSKEIVVISQNWLKQPRRLKHLIWPCPSPVLSQPKTAPGIVSGLSGQLGPARELGRELIWVYRTWVSNRL